MINLLNATYNTYIPSLLNSYAHCNETNKNLCSVMRFIYSFQGVNNKLELGYVMLHFWSSAEHYARNIHYHLNMGWVQTLPETL